MFSEVREKDRNLVHLRDAQRPPAGLSCPRWSTRDGMVGLLSPPKGRRSPYGTHTVSSHLVEDSGRSGCGLAPPTGRVRYCCYHVGRSLLEEEPPEGLMTLAER